MLNHKKILITGATGFVGYHLAATLAKTNQVYCLVRPTSNLNKLQALGGLNFIFYDGDLSELSFRLSTLQFDLCYHLASLFVAEHSIDQVDDLINTNIKFPTQLLEALTKNNNNVKLINTGSAWQNYSAEFYDPVCLYAATKQSFEAIISYYHQVKQLSCITLRLYDTYGPDDERKKLLWLLAKAKKTKQILEMSPGQQRLNMVHIVDVVKAFELAGAKLLASSAIINEIYGVYAKEDYSLRELVEFYELANNCKLNIKWGGRNYRQRELMQPHYPYQLLPGWQPQHKITDANALLAT